MASSDYSSDVGSWTSAWAGLLKRMIANGGAMPQTRVDATRVKIEPGDTVGAQQSSSTPTSSVKPQADDADSDGRTSMSIAEVYSCTTTACMKAGSDQLSVKESERSVSIVDIVHLTHHIEAHLLAHAVSTSYLPFDVFASLLVFVGV
jgi:hypothetical protein